LAGSEKRLASYRALAEKQREGKLVDIGVSNFGCKHLEELLASGVGPKPAVNQIEVRLARLPSSTIRLG
jgi:diketogulonate reductase-like aldo/keto reductase